jgi:hypothetical protein
MPDSYEALRLRCDGARSVAYSTCSALDLYIDCVLDAEYYGEVTHWLTLRPVVAHTS